MLKRASRLPCTLRVGVKVHPARHGRDLEGALRRTHVSSPTYQCCTYLSPGPDVLLPGILRPIQCQRDVLVSAHSNQ